MHYLYMNARKNKENLDILKFVCKFAIERWLVKTHTGGRHQKVRSFFHIYGKNFLKIRTFLRLPLPLSGGTFLKKEEKTKKIWLFQNLFVYLQCEKTTKMIHNGCSLQ